MKYQVGGAVHASTWVGVFEANSPEEAIERAYEATHVSVCHKCAEKISDPEVACLWAEDESGNVTSEPSDHDKLVEAHNLLAVADNRRREGRRLLRKMVDRVRAGDAKRLAQLVEQVDDYLQRSHDPADVLRRATGESREGRER